MKPDAELQKKKIVDEERNLPITVDGGEPPVAHSSEPQNQQEYWRWVQLQLLRERAGRS